MNQIRQVFNFKSTKWKDKHISVIEHHVTQLDALNKKLLAQLEVRKEKLINYWLNFLIKIVRIR